jgi:glycosyltransferase involved in cell wall biosynthesis
VPAKIFEYLACGLPIVINLKSVAWDIVNEAKAGVLANEDDATDLANKILYLYNHKSEALKMGENGRAYALENYDRKKIVEKLEKVIVATLNTH